MRKNSEIMAKGHNANIPEEYSDIQYIRITEGPE